MKQECWSHSASLSATMSTLTKVNLNKILFLRSQRYVAYGRHLSNGNLQTKNVEVYPKIADVYAGKSVFITGGTGFIGKVLIERLLYNCKDIKNIYVLIRQKKGVTLESRLETMLSVPLFSKLKETRPYDLEKVIAVQGDLFAEQLGINKADQNELEENVDIVFHSAASVLFKDSFRDLMRSNYDGTRKVMDLSKRMKNLHAFVYFSTAFMNVARKYLDEKPIQPLASDEDIEYCLKTGDTSRLRKISRAPIYTFSKNFTEVMVERERGDLPTVMIRPSVVTATLRDPFPGWMDTWIGNPSFYLEHARGLVSVAIGHKDVVGDLIPCDYVVNLAIAAAARGNRTKEMLIYNCTTGTTNPITWLEAFDMFRGYSLKDGQWDLPPRKMILTASPLGVHVLSFIRDRIPAILGDMYLRMRGKEPKYVKFQNRALFMKESLWGLMDTSLFFKSTRPLLLAQTLDEEDKVRFQFDTTTIKWPEYIHLIYRSIYKYLLNKNKSN